MLSSYSARKSRMRVSRVAEVFRGRGICVRDAVGLSLRVKLRIARNLVTQELIRRQRVQHSVFADDARCAIAPNDELDRLILPAVGRILLAAKVELPRPLGCGQGGKLRPTRERTPKIQLLTLWQRLSDRAGEPASSWPTRVCCLTCRLARRWGLDLGLGSMEGSQKVLKHRRPTSHREVYFKGMARRQSTGAWISLHLVAADVWHAYGVKDIGAVRSR